MLDAKLQIEVHHCISTHHLCIPAMHHDRTLPGWQKPILIFVFTSILFPEFARLYEGSGPPLSVHGNVTQMFLEFIFKLPASLWCIIWSISVCLTYVYHILLIYIYTCIHTFLCYSFIFALTDSEFWWCIRISVSVRPWHPLPLSGSLATHLLLCNLYLLHLYLYLCFFVLSEKLARPEGKEEGAIGRK